MPTASTAQILGNCESFEPYTSNIYTRRVLSGEFQVQHYHCCMSHNIEVFYRIEPQYGSILLHYLSTQGRRAFSVAGTHCLNTFGLHVGPVM